MSDNRETSAPETYIFDVRDLVAELDQYLTRYFADHLPDALYDDLRYSWFCYNLSEIFVLPVKHEYASSVDVFDKTINFSMVVPHLGEVLFRTIKLPGLNNHTSVTIELRYKSLYIRFQ